jgi:hypothetical protein
MAIDFSDLGAIPVPAQSGKGIDFSDLGAVDVPKTTPPENKWLRRASTYGIHPAIEGGAMALGGTAAGIAALPASPLASAIAAPAGAIAMYPPAHKAANAVDEMLGLSHDETTLPEDLKSGVEMEAAGRALPAVAGAVSKIPFAKFAEGMTGSPARNFTRTFKKGLSTYAAPSVEEAGAKFGAEQSRLAGNLLTPEQQAAMAVNPSGEANRKLSDTITRWLNGEKISVKDALMARQAVDTIFPADTARKQVQRGMLGQFRSAMNDVLATGAPEMKAASDEYASAKLKSQMLQPLRVNKSNPDQPSKLGIMLGIPEAALAGHGDFLTAIGSFAAQSPAFMGFISAVSGQVAKMLPHLSPDAQVNLARGLFASFRGQQSNSVSPLGGTR